MAQSGSVTEILVQSRGSQLVGDHAAAATTLLVADPTPFDDEDGGQIFVDGTAYTYTDVDEIPDAVDPSDVNAVLTLSAGLAAAVVDTTPVEVWNGAQVLDDVVLLVSVTDEGDPPVRVTLRADQRYLWEANPGPVEPPVAVLVSDDYTTLLDAPGYSPSIDGGAIIGLPDPAEVALEEPAESPEITGLTGNAEGFVVVTEAVLPSTLLDYYVNGTLVAEGTRTTILQLSFEDLAHTVPLKPDTDYTVTVLAQNSAGPATAGPSSGKTGRLNPGVTVAQVVGLLQAGMILTGYIGLGTQMVLDQNGLTITHPDGRQTYMRSDGSGNQFVGQAILDAVTILGNLTILGQTSFLNGLLTAGKGVSDPTSKPGVTTDYDSITTWIGSGFGYTRGLVLNGANWYSVNTFYGGQAFSWTTAAGAFNGNTTFSTDFNPSGGVVKSGANWYVLGRDSTRGNAWFVYIYDAAWHKTGEWAPVGAVTSELTIGLDGTTILIALRNAANNMYLDTYSLTGVSGGAGLNVGTAWGSVIPTSVHRRPVDTATVRWVVATLNNGIRVFDTGTGARVTAEEFPAATARIDGMAYDGTNWHTFDGSKVHHYTNLIGTWDFGFTWRDSDAGGSGIAETKISTLRTLSPAKRARWTISLPSAPFDDGTVDGSNTASLYAAPTGNTPVLQAALAEGTYSKAFTTLALAGAAPPPVNGFAARPGAIGRFIAAALDSDNSVFWDFKGDGPSRFGPWQFDLNNNAYGGNGAANPSSEDTPSGDASPTGTTNVTLPALAIGVSSPGTKAVYKVTIEADVQVTTAGTNIIELLVDGVAQARQLITAGPASTRVAGTKTWRITGLTAGGPHAFTARTRMVTNGTGATVSGTHTVMHVVQL